MIAANANPGDDQIFINLLGTQVLELAGTLDVSQNLQINSLLPTGFTNAQLLTGLTLRAAPGVVELIQVSGGNTQLRNLTLENGDLDVLLGTSRVIFDQTTGTSTFAEVITGAGVLEKQGAGTLILTGVNTYTGDTTIGAGRLQGDSESILGGTSVDPRLITDNGVLAFDQDADDPIEFFGEITGTGSLVKDGPGTLYLLNENNDYAGGTTIEEGTLVGFVGVPGDILVGSLQGNIANNATLVFDQLDDGGFDGNISGSGDVVKIGPALLVLVGNNTFEGLLTIEEGLLIGRTGSIPGDVQIDSGAQLVFDQRNDDLTPRTGTHSGDITGGGGLGAGLFSVILTGGGTLTLTGNNTYVGGTLVENGALIGTTASLQGLIRLNAAGTTSLAFSQNFDGSFAGQIEGPGALFKRGSGRLSILNAQNFTGGTTVEAGALELANAGTLLPGNLTIQSAGTLAGIGSVGGAVTTSGTIAPGGQDDADVGTLSLSSVEFLSGSALEVDIDGVGTSDLLSVTNLASLTSAAALRFDLDNVSRDQSFDATVLTAGGGLAGSVFTVSQSSGFFDVTVEPVGNSVVLHFVSNGATFPSFAETDNQAAVGQALEDALAGTPSDDLLFVEDELSELDTSEIPRALADMSGEQLTEFATARLAIGDRLHTSLHERIRGVAWGDGEALLARQGDGPGEPVIAANPLAAHALSGFAVRGASPLLAAAAQSMSSILDADSGTDLPPQGELGLGAWADGYGLFGTLEGDSDTADLDYTIGGASLGVDYLIAQRWLVGAAGGYAYSDLDFDSLPGSQIAHSGQGALYAGWVAPWLQVGASGHFGYSAMSTDRKIRFLDRKADADFDGWDAGFRGEAALDLYRIGAIELQPLASFSYIHVQQDEIDEDGADSLDLKGDEEEVDSLVSGLGARIHGIFEMDRELWFHPELRARWLHEFGDTERRLTARIGGDPGASFQVDGTEAPTDTGVVGVRWEVIAGKRMHVFAEYDAALSSELLQHGASLGFKFVW